MDEAAFNALAARLEREAASRPRWYRVKLAGLALLGYGFIIGILALVLGAVAAVCLMAVSMRGSGYLAVKLLGVLLPLGYVICRSLWVSLPPPEGLEIRAEDAPNLHALVRELQLLLQTPRIDVLIITMEFNAGVVQIPRIGVFGWHRNYLVLGWPLLLALSPDGFKSVLAHEFGHLSAAHGRFAARIYRIRQTWFNLMHALQTGGQWGTGLFSWFFSWYAPAFGAASFVLARHHEYHADRLAALATGARTMAEALLATVVREAQLDSRFWPGIQRSAALSEQPPGEIFRLMRRELAEPVSPEETDRWVNRARCRRTEGVDTHPALLDRLAALGCPDARPPQAPAVCAVDAMFPEPLRNAIERALSAKWQEQVSDAWTQAHSQGAAAAGRLAELEALAAAGEIPVEDALEQIRLVTELHGVEAAAPLLERLHRRAPDHPQANYGIGHLLLLHGDRSGIEYISKAMDTDPEAVLNGCGLIIEFFHERNMRAEAEPYLARLKARQQLLANDQEERESLPFSDVYLPHGLPAETVTGIVGRLGGYELLSEAYLVRRKLTWCPEAPLFVLGLRLSVPFYRMWGGAAEEGRVLSERIAAELPLPGQFLILHLHDENEPLLACVKKVAQARIYQRESA
ncbi:MAG TPA: M48 family metalloprotease [Candidatus Ozemobacteraceae bacterium]|nr:M48 family metalloprotease [Candidatus Ozemobacteraceae bacterium]